MEREVTTTDNIITLRIFGENDTARIVIRNRMEEILQQDKNESRVM